MVYALFITRMSILVVLLVSAQLHLNNPYRFVGQIAAYHITSSTLTVCLAAIIPVAQLFFACCILFRALEKLACWLVVIMLVGFCCAQLSAVFSGEEISCGCFGKYSPIIGIESVLFTSFFALLTAFLACFSRSSTRSDLT